MDTDLFLDAAPVRRKRDAALRLRWPRALDSMCARLVLGGLLALVLGMGLVAVLLTVRAERDLLRQSAVREQVEAQRIAAQLQQRLEQLHATLARAAAGLDPGTSTDADRLAALLQRQVLTDSSFSDAFAARPDGRVVAFVDAAGPRPTTLSLRERDDFRTLLATRRATVSEPLSGHLSSEPVVVFSHPVLHRGDVVLVIGGSLRLSSRDLLADLGGEHDGGDVVRVALADGTGRLLAHPDRMQLLRPVLSDPRFSGDRYLVAAATEGVASWQVWRSVPSAAVLAPLHAARRLALRDAAGVALALAGLLAAYLAWQLQPLLRLERHAEAMLAGHETGAWPQSDGEVGRLSRTLQHLWAERTQMEAFNEQLLQKLGSVMACAPVGLVFTRNQCIELVSTELCRMLGARESDLLGQRAQIFFASSDDFHQLGPAVGAAFALGQPYRGEWQLLRADGSRFWALLRARPVSAGQPQAGTIWTVNDISEEVVARRQLEHAANHDSLTGVVNRQGFEQVLQSLFDGQPATRPASLVMIDLDHFKPINDSAGHAAGDAMLVAVAQAIASRVRSSDIVVRLGGDEFALLLPHCAHDRALAVADKVREAITDLALTWEGHTLRVGASLGVSELAAHHASAAQWIAQADAALYEAKRAGRGRVRVARPATWATAR